MAEVTHWQEIVGEVEGMLRGESGSSRQYVKGIEDNQNRCAGRSQEARIRSLAFFVNKRSYY